MENRFTKALNSYNETSRKISDLENSEEKSLNELAELKESLDDLTQKRADQIAGDKKSQEEVLELQKIKIGVMDELKKELSCLDNPECEFEKNEKQIEIFYSEEESLFYVDESGKKISLTLGEVLTDSYWGIEYFSKKGSIPRSIHKKIIVERAKSKLKLLLDLQIAKDKISSRYTPPGQKRSYQQYALQLFKNPFRLNIGEEFGIISEKIVINFLKKISIDYDVDFEIEETDAHKDISRKTDFVILRRTKSGEKRENIQLTTLKNPRDLKRKEDSLKRLKLKSHKTNVKLVRLDGKYFNKPYEEWVEKGARPGGPDKLIYSEDKKDILRKTLSGLYTPEEMDELIEKIKFED